jgi:hypothetical protein
VYFVLLAPRNKRPPPITATTTTGACEEWTAAETLKALQGAKPQRQTGKPTPTNSDSEPTSESDDDDDDNNDGPLTTTPNAETLAPQLTDTESDSGTSESTTGQAAINRLTAPSSGYANAPGKPVSANDFRRPLPQTDKAISPF